MAFRKTVVDNANQEEICIVKFFIELVHLFHLQYSFISTSLSCLTFT